MKRWVIALHGRDSLRIDEAPTPSPSAGEVLVRVSTAALNARDLMIIDEGMGLHLEFPFVLASDMAGVVEAVGDGVTRFAPAHAQSRTSYLRWSTAALKARNAANVVQEVFSNTRGRSADHVLDFIHRAAWWHRTERVNDANSP